MTEQEEKEFAEALFQMVLKVKAEELKAVLRGEAVPLVVGSSE
jgi:hypothetical protein